MKKSTLALSVAAALCGFGFAGNALANNLGGATADTMILSQGGIGHQLVFPYFTTQGENATMLNITNTDTKNGKLVKVRFRGAANSDDVFDFQVLMSPGDMWTAAVTQDASSKISVMKSADKSCLLPADASGQQFITTRVDPAPVTGNSANETREGYIEVINMADIPEDTTSGSLYTAIKHVKGVAPCTASVLEAKLGKDFDTLASANAAGLTNPTGGLAGNWIILNQANTSVWSGSATAMQAVKSTTDRVNATGNLVYWPQKDEAPSSTWIANTADPLFVTKVVTIRSFDLPDLSTPYVISDLANPFIRSNNTSMYFAVNNVANEFVTDDGIAAVTDLLFTQPTRRYHVAVNYKATSAAANNTAITGTLASPIYSTGFVEGLSGYYSTANTTMDNRRVCLNNMTKPALDTLFDREEGTAAGTGFVVSPGVPGLPFAICGEAAVTSVNAKNSDGTLAASSLSATVARNNIDFPGFVDGWLTFDTSNAGLGVPMIGASFIRIANGTVNYGVAWNNKVTRTHPSN